MNEIVADKLTPASAQVGDGCTIWSGSDCNPATIVERSASGKTIWLVKDEVLVTGGDYYAGDQTAVFNPVSDYRARKAARWSEAAGCYQIGGRRGQSVTAGRAYYRDPER